MLKPFFSWLVANRTSARVAFVLRTACMGVGMLLSLYWSRALLRALGTENFGLMASFASFLALAGAGELGLGGAVGVRTGHLLAEGKIEMLRRFHAVARACLLVVSLTGAVLLLALSPWLPGWLHFDQTVARGPLEALFAAAAPSFAFGIYASYLSNSSYVAGTVSWDILPNFFLNQLNLATQVVLASFAAPLWVMQVCSALNAFVGLRLLLLIYRNSHPIFQRPLPLSFHREILGELGRGSFWVYLFGLALLINTATDRLIINGTFGAATVSIFSLNGRLTELALTVVVSAAFVGMPKIVGLLLHPDHGQRTAGLELAKRLGRLQSFLGLAGALVYLMANDYFIRWLYGAAYIGPLALQAAFGATFILLANSDIFWQLGGRLSHAGLRVFGCAVLAAALINFTLSLLAAHRFHWMAGVAWSTAAAQVALYFFVSEYVRRRHGLGSFVPTFLRTFFMPLAIFAIACAGKAHFTMRESASPVLLTFLALFLLLIYSLLAGPGPKDLLEEFRLLRQAVPLRRRSS